MTKDSQGLARLLAMDTGDLLAYLGTQLDAERHAVPLPREQCQVLARQWLDAHGPEFGQRIRAAKTVRRYLHRGGARNALPLASAVAGCIAPVCDDAAPGVVAVLLVKLGLDDLCEGRAGPLAGAR